jgi:hypothetical protein
LLLYVFTFLVRGAWWVGFGSAWSSGWVGDGDVGVDSIAGGTGRGWGSVVDVAVGLLFIIFDF